MDTCLVRVFSVYCVRATWAGPEGRGRDAVYSLFDSVSVQVCASDSEWATYRKLNTSHDLDTRQGPRLASPVTRQRDRRSVRDERTEPCKVYALAGVKGEPS